ncbi:adhesion G-protein coupled receptor G6-like [Pectinophora gossypiella]|uniref:adhesion G-protein coupled receptor G6-like n=1 Tax=Pectinophora gossypiella TaxID=13191 RepID=UPI00214ECAA7|nr:adhesion G-protein coupled receptor G6-like [Pectinophora gossypiella]
MDPFVTAVAGVSVCGVGAVTSLVTLFISSISWAIIPRWRTFKNYVFLNIIFAFNFIYYLPLTLFVTSYCLDTKISYVALDITVNFFMFAACCWLMVMAMIFYTDLVKVFGSTITRKLLKSNLFGWGLPVVVSTAKIVNKLIIFRVNEKELDEGQLLIYHKVFYWEEVAQNVVMMLLLLVNFLVYVRVVYELIKIPKVRCHGKRGEKLKVATLAFVMSGILLLISILMTVLMLTGAKDKYYLYPLGLAMFGVQTTVINVCYLRSKVIRQTWKQHVKDIQRAKRNRELEIDTSKLSFTMDNTNL